MQTTNKKPLIAIVVALIIFLVCLVCFAAGLFLYLVLHDRRSDAYIGGNAPNPTVSSTDASGTTTTPSAAWTIISATMLQTTSTANVNLVYPQLKDYPDASVMGDFNSKIQTEMQKISDEVTSIPADSSAAIPNSANLDYTVSFKSDDVISIVAQGSEYTGGAHPNALVFTFTYDLKAGKKLVISDLFTPGSTYLKAISDYAVAELNTRGLGDSDTVTAGAGQNVANYIFFDVTTTPAGIEVVFPPYQIAPYAAGTQTVSIPVSVFGTFVKPEYKAVFGL